MQKSYFLDNGNYFDVTTGREYQPKLFCEICGKHNNLTVHHYIEQHRALNDLSAKRTPINLTQEFISDNQKLFTLCIDCHTDVHNLSDKRFYEKYDKQRSKYVY